MRLWPCATNSVKFGLVHFFKRRTDTASPSMLGHLEMTLMELLWAGGEGNVRDVAQRLGRPLAYTTVMTTLDRLFKKGLLDRRKSERAFVYAPRFSRRAWEHKLAGDFVAGFMERPQPSRELLNSCLVH